MNLPESHFTLLRRVGVTQLCREGSTAEDVIKDRTRKAQEELDFGRGEPVVPNRTHKESLKRSCRRESEPVLSEKIRHIQRPKVNQEVAALFQPLREGEAERKFRPSQRLPFRVVRTRLEVFVVQLRLD